MRHGSLFSGIGGFDLAAEWMGWENIFHCEFNPFCQKVLHKHFPNSIQHGDIKTTDFTQYRGRIDIVSGGFPCQPYSAAGKRKGTADDRHLWPEMLRAISEIQPRWIVGENVPGLLNWERGMVLKQIETDLETAGYKVCPSLVLPACGVNAPHRRDRVWIVAYSVNGGYRTNGKQDGKPDSLQGISRETVRPGLFNRTDSGVITNTEVNIGNNENKPCTRSQTISQKRFNEHSFDANTKYERLQRSKVNGITEGIGQNGNEQFARCVSSSWQEFPTQPPVCGRDDGISNRVDRIKALGNSVVPQVVYEIFKAIEQTNSTL